MTTQILFVQGGGEGVHDQWDNRLVASLAKELGARYEIRYPRMPNEASPDYKAWKSALEQEFARLDRGAILIGHSIGATILVNALAEAPPDVAPGAIMLIAAPFVGSGGWASHGFYPPDLASRLPREVPVFLYHGSRDGTVPVAHLDLYAAAIPGARLRRLEGRDHQLDDDLAEIARDIRGLA
jgi:predicted alpha/beta hydrolase family esterase